MGIRKQKNIYDFLKRNKKENPAQEYFRIQKIKRLAHEMREAVDKKGIQ